MAIRRDSVAEARDQGNGAPIWHIGRLASVWSATRPHTGASGGPGRPVAEPGALSRLGTHWQAGDVEVPEKDAVPTWEEVARRYGRFIYSVAYRLTGNHDDAQDLVQEVLLRVHRGLATYTPGTMEGWLSRITTNAFLDETRRRKRRPTTALGSEGERLLPATPGADEELQNVSLPAHLQVALTGLPDEYRATVVLCDVAGLSYADIAETLGVPVGTVRSRIHRGRMLLRAALE